MVTCRIKECELYHWSSRGCSRWPEIAERDAMIISANGGAIRAAQNALLDGLEPANARADLRRVELFAPPGDEQQVAPALRLGGKPSLVHEPHAPEQVGTRDARKSLLNVGRVEAELARDRVAIHADDERRRPRPAGDCAAQCLDLRAERDRKSVV